MECNGNGDVEDDIQMLGLSNWKLYRPGEREVFGSSKFKSKMSSLVWVMPSPLLKIRGRLAQYGSVVEH